jgi:23S rRNA pseudouridine1911/1915/1917 synthase
LSLRFVPPHVRIVDEGEHWIVVEKPAHLLVHPSKPSPNVTLWHELRGLLAFEIACGGQVSIINRLDRETSGLTLVAKDGATASAFCKLMEQRRIHKEYLALTWGWPAQDAWTVDAPLLRLGEQAPSRIYLKRAVHPLGVPARTRFRVEQRFENEHGRFALLRAWPETGRLHQIRVHLAHSGHAVVGDKLYGPDEGCYLEFIETGWTEALAQRLLLPRHALHSASLQIDGLRLEWSIGLPEDLASFAQTTTQQPICTDSR